MPFFGRGEQPSGRPPEAAVQQAVMELEHQRYLAEQHRAIEQEGCRRFGQAVRETVRTRSVNSLVSVVDGMPTWSPELCDELEADRQMMLHATRSQLLRFGGDQREDEEYKREFYPKLMNITEAAVVIGLRHSLDEAIFHGQDVTGIKETLKILPVTDDALLKDEVDYWRQNALKAIELAKRSGYTAPTVRTAEQVAGIFGNYAAGNKTRIAGMSVAKYKLGILRAMYDRFEDDGESEKAADVDRLSRLVFEKNGEPLSVAEQVLARRQQRLVVGNSEELTQAVEENVSHIMNGTRSDMAKKFIAAGAGAVIIGTAAAGAAAAVPRAPGSSPVSLEGVFTVNPGSVKIVSAVSGAGSVAPEALSVTVGSVAPVSNGVAAEHAAMQEALAASVRVNPEKVDVVQAKAPEVSSDPQARIKQDIARIAVESGPHAAAALIQEQAEKGDGAEQKKAIENPLLSEKINQLVEAKMEAMANATILSEEDAYINQRYLAFLIAAAENPHSLDVLDKSAKDALLNGLLTEEPEAMKKLAAGIWKELNTVEHGAWAGFSEEQQQLVSFLLATIDSSMMSQAELQKLLPPPPEAKPAPAAPETKAPAADKIAVNPAEVKSAQTQAVIKELLKFGVPDAEIAGYYVKYAEQYGVPLDLLVSQGKWESVHFKKSVIYGPAQSRAAAKGIAQFIDPTWKAWKAKLDFPAEATPYMPRYAIEAQAAMMKGSLKKAKGNVPLALAGYNAGWGAIAEYGGVPPYKETRDYIARISGSIEKLGPRIEAAEAAARQAVEKKVRDANAKAEAEAKAKAAAEAKAKAESEARERASRNAERESDVEIIKGPVTSEGWGLPLDPKAYAREGDGAEYLGYKKIKANHDGKDYPVPTGTKVLAPRDGVVQYVGYYGNSSILVVVIDHGIIDGRHIQTNYEHVSEFKVKKGDKVKLGQVIALSGNSGADQNLSSGPHLHVTYVTDDPDGNGRVGVHRPKEVVLEQTDDPNDHFPGLRTTKKWLAAS